MAVERLGRRFAGAAITVLLMLGRMDPACAVDFDNVVTFDIPAQKLSFALLQFGRQTGVQVMTDAADIDAIQTPGVRGKLSIAAALQRLLGSSDLQYQEAGPNSIIVKKGPEQASARTRRISGLTTSVPGAAVLASDNADSQPQNAGQYEAVTVTGTRIKGAVTSSPIIRIDAGQIREAGYRDLGEVIRGIPQNFSGGQNPGIMSAIGGGIANQNLTAGSALNLRGLGPDATLTLLNGRRLSYDGFAQAVDISTIPVAALDRIEIIADGASAIYGSDAVAGVANVILKRDFEGATASGHVAMATDDGLDTRQYSLTAGHTWAGGGFIAAYEYKNADPVYADQRSYTQYMLDPATLYPEIEQGSALLSVHQSLGEFATFSIDALHTSRDTQTVSARPGLLYYSFPATTVTTVSPSVSFSLPKSWSLSLSGTYGEDESISNLQLLATSGASLFRSAECYCNETRAGEIGAEGSLFMLRGGEVRLAVGAGYRREEFATTRIEGERSSRYAYSEINLPLVPRLSATAAFRYEDYDSFGDVTTPKLGVIYQPTADLSLKASWGRSFKAPTLLQQHQAYQAYLYPAAQMGGQGYPIDATALMTYGGNPDLRPERAVTWTASIVFQPESIRGLELELGYFDIDYTGRVVQPVTNTTVALRESIYAEFLDLMPSPQMQAEAIAAASAGIINYTGGAYDPADVVAIVNNQYINVTQQRIKGIDLSGSYGFDFAAGRMTLRGSSTWLDSSQRNSGLQPQFDLAGTIYNPAKFRARAGAVWSRSGITLSSFVNHMGSVLDNRGAASSRLASLTTVDLVASYATQRDGLLSNMDLTLAAQNVFDEPPPTYMPLYSYIGNFDSTNYSPIGRFLGLSLSKHW